MRFPADPASWQSLLEALDAEWEKWPARERPLFPPNPNVPGHTRPAGAPLALALTAPTPAPHDISSTARGSGHTVTHED